MTPPSPAATIDVVTLLPFVHSIARRLHSRRPEWLLSHEDLVQEGMLALLRAQGRYDPARGCTFTTYAYPRIRGAMLDCIRRQLRLHGWARELPHSATVTTKDETYHIRRIDVSRASLSLTSRETAIVAEFALGHTDATRAEREGKHRSAITRERHRAFAHLAAGEGP